MEEKRIRAKVNFFSNQIIELKKGERFFLGNALGNAKNIFVSFPFFLELGSFILIEDTEVGQIEDSFWSFSDSIKKQKVYIAKAVKDFVIEKGENTLTIQKQGFSLGVITLSDKGAEGKREDKSAPLIFSMIKEVLPITYECYFIIPDEKYMLYDLLIKLCLEDQIDIVVTTGGTGVTSRDITADVTEKVIERRLSGFEWAMFNEGIKKTPFAIISRAVCGILKKTTIINLPGSPKAVKENLSPLLPALSHFMAKLNDSPEDCASF